MPARRACGVTATEPDPTESACADETRAEVEAETNTSPRTRADRAASRSNRSKGAEDDAEPKPD